MYLYQGLWIVDHEASDASVRGMSRDTNCTPDRGTKVWHRVVYRIVEQYRSILLALISRMMWHYCIAAYRGPCWSARRGVCSSARTLRRASPHLRTIHPSMHMSIAV
ncbi:hypothetical protein HBI56_183660 [Parastagonospora nodorum]|uniref:Uncharacterized protein n=1 Tax=Phaeosphaeria nodorum (strain SN15 / ATCC MYA-4574 / FGSC 10173) TaxID=321614 RepID=A0A7U2FD45_PHANO|nr:hypothetical protein HBH56_192130 [Parastagonospora nodorum]QRD03053.1 hypothetical protein JI435_419000 [Parastagonospora nodorum SN15]KAH3938174.1 hypothetical protein HBH54_009850 [Parastagonospora nodorum]KAH3940758.1 hypothetical protein HBH53_212480 [Parastagonospora nodorum]KAH3994125.1 hypothetical protein HBI10_189690 [Parastagonospora nodorum]